MDSNDLISRALALEVINAVKGATWSQSGKVLCSKMFSQIKDLPAVDAMPVVHSRWDEIRDYSQAGLISFECSECGRLCDTLYKYCPHCGAKMAGRVESGEIP